MPEGNKNLTPSENLAVEKAQKDAQQPSFELKKFFKDSVAPAKESDVAAVDTAFNNLKFGAKSYVENYASEAAQAITAMKKYILQVYADLEEKIQGLNKPEDRAEWKEKLLETKRKAMDYRATLTAFLNDFSKQVQKEKKDGIGMNELWVITERCNEIFSQMYGNPEYGKIIQAASADAMTNSSFEFIYTKIQKRDTTKGGGLRMEDSEKLLEQSGVAAIFQAMDEGERVKFGEYLIDAGKPDALAMIKSLVGSNFMSIVQGEHLIDKLIAKDPGLAPQRTSIIAEMTRMQEKTAAVQESIGKRLERRQYRNQMHRATEPKFMAGLLLTAWRGVNGFATLLAYRKDLKELAGSPYFYLDVLGVAGGLSLMSNGEVFKFLKKMTDGHRDQKELMRRGALLMETTNRYPSMSKQYFEKGGTVEIIDTLRVERAKQKKAGPLTMEEVIAEADKEYVTNKNPGLKESLKKILSTEQQRQFLKIAQQVYDYGQIKNTDNYTAHIKTAREAQNAAPPATPTKTP